MIVFTAASVTQYLPCFLKCVLPNTHYVFQDTPTWRTSEEPRPFLLAQSFFSAEAAGPAAVEAAADADRCAAVPVPAWRCPLFAWLLYSTI